MTIKIKKSSATNFIIFLLIIFALSLINIRSIRYSSELNHYLNLFETARYLDIRGYFANARSLASGNEPGFAIITYLLAHIFSGELVYSLIIILCWAIMYLSIVKSEKRNIFKLNFLILLIPNISFLYIYDDQLRNFVAITFVISGLFLRNYNAILISPFFHFSSLMILPSYLYQTIRKRPWTLVPILVALVYFVLSVWQNLAESFVGMKISTMLYSDQFSKTEAEFGFLGLIILMGLFAWFFTIDRKWWNSENIFAYWTLLCIWILSFLFNNPTIMDRTYVYLFIYTIFCLEKFLSKKNSIFFTVPISVAFIVQSYLYWFGQDPAFSFKSLFDFVWYAVVFISMLIVLYYNPIRKFYHKGRDSRLAKTP